MGKKNNDVIDLTKFILSAFVVAIHAQLFHEYIYPFVRLAVPMFFILSGYFAFANLDPIQDKLEKKRKMLCITQRFLKLYLSSFPSNRNIQFLISVYLYPQMTEYSGSMKTSSLWTC